MNKISWQNRHDTVLYESDHAADGHLGITDISRIKWAEGLQNQRLKEAEETRRQQNNFIDITSHEMRNPLSVSELALSFIMHTF